MTALREAGSEATITPTQPDSTPRSIRPMTLLSEWCSTTSSSARRESQWTISSIKGEVKKKHFTHGRMFFCSPARPIEQDCSRFPFLDLGTLLKSCSAFGFLYQRFSSPLHDEASLF